MIYIYVEFWEFFLQNLSENFKIEFPNFSALINFRFKYVEISNHVSNFPNFGALKFGFRCT